MKKILTCVILCILFLCGCTQKDNRTVVQFASWGSKSEIDIIKPILEDFEKENPDIKVDFMHIPQNYFQKIHLLFASNTAPDVIFINNLYLPIYANAGVLEGIGQPGNEVTESEEQRAGRQEGRLINSEKWKIESGKFDDFQPSTFNFEPDKDSSQFTVHSSPDTVLSSYRLNVLSSYYYPQALNALSWKGKLYAVPRDISNLVIYYNKDLFDKKNIPYPNPNWTFNDFLKTAEKLTDKNTFGISFEEEPLYYLPYLMSNGGGILPDEINKPESQNSIKFYADLRNKYHVAPKKSESASATMAQMFLQQRLGMYLSGRWMVPKFRQECQFNWDVINFPKGSKGSIVQLDASGWAISKTSKHKPEALRLIEYLSSESSSKKFAQSGLIVPARIDCANSIIDNKKPKSSKVFIDTIYNSKPTPVTTNYREITDNFKKSMEKIVN